MCALRPQTRHHLSLPLLTFFPHRLRSIPLPPPPPPLSSRRPSAHDRAPARLSPRAIIFAIAVSFRRRRRDKDRRRNRRRHSSGEADAENLQGLPQGEKQLADGRALLTQTTERALTAAFRLPLGRASEKGTGRGQLARIVDRRRLIVTLARGSLRCARGVPWGQLKVHLKGLLS